MIMHRAAPAWRRAVALLIVALFTCAPRSAFAVFNCNSIAVDCKCSWSDSGSYEQLGGLSKAPAAADDSAGACERYCCLTQTGQKDGPLSGGGGAGEGRCNTWQWLNKDKDPKASLGCWVGYRQKADYKEGGTLFADDWVGGSGCLGQYKPRLPPPSLSPCPLLALSFPV